MTDMAARLGLGQLVRLDEFTARRRTLARRYFERFDHGSGCDLPPEDFEQSNWHMFQVVLPERANRGDFIGAMARRGIGIGVHYPAMHRFALYRAMGYGDGDFPVAERIGRGIVTLPLFPGMQDGDVDRVCAALAATISALPA